MRYDRVIELVSVSFTEDALGQEIEVPTSRTVFANEFTIGAGEFYEAGRSGMKPEREYQVRSAEYHDEPELIADGVRYQIIRPLRRGEWTRLTCQRRVGTPAGEVS